jgi:hypothetical protein
VVRFDDVLAYHAWVRVVEFPARRWRSKCAQIVSFHGRYRGYGVAYG